MRGCEALVHVAALYSYDPADEAALARVNIEGTRTVLAAAARAGRAADRPHEHVRDVRPGRRAPGDRGRRAAGLGARHPVQADEARGGEARARGRRGRRQPDDARRRRRPPADADGRDGRRRRARTVPRLHPDDGRERRRRARRRRGARARARARASRRALPPRRHRHVARRPLRPHRAAGRAGRGRASACRTASPAPPPRSASSTGTRSRSRGCRCSSARAKAEAELGYRPGPVEPALARAVADLGRRADALRPK